MREIKFRGKRVDNGEWVYGYYVRHETRQRCLIGDDELKPEEIKHLIVVDSFADWNMPRQLQGIEVIPETVGQYTGLKDKNGVEICEGDIVQAENDVLETHSRGDMENGTLEVWDELECTIDAFGEIKFEDSAFMIEEYFLAAFKECELEVVGNVHDNPELLT